ncbi:MAG: transcriptional regulator [Leptolyngbyaceae cyanobacterium SM1_1_3]|nr:transcriptional regulator [Leptolyngbyaceae cyanobacterium SM1_1_3]NJN01152.1 transcriptional regulator [Leptolyngbyaceae cyanobacterium RM1_1_2]NJO09269.1 transcriptional regulator [Leptolyngbyaceae cyanobacterium SL_1_1]
MHVEDIKAALRKQGWTLTSIAKELNIGTSAVSHALTRQR